MSFFARLEGFRRIWIGSSGQGSRGNLRTMDSDARAELQRLIARLPEAVVPAALRAVAELAAKRDPFLTHVLAAEEDDEELNAIGQQMLREAREDSAAGRTHSLEEVERELGL